MDNNQPENIEQIVKKGTTMVIGCFGYTLLAAAYVAAIIYAESHAFSMLSKGVEPEFMVWAAAGMVVVGIVALVLPLMIVFVTKSILQMSVSIVFLAIDWAIMIANSAIHFQSQATGTIPGWGVEYMNWVLPATPILVAVMVLVEVLLSPAIMKRIKMARVEAAIDDYKMDRRLKHLSDSLNLERLDAGAADEADIMVARFGGRQPRRQPVIEAEYSEPVTQPANPTTRQQPAKK